MSSFEEGEVGASKYQKLMGIGKKKCVWYETDRSKAEEEIRNLFSRVYEEETLKVVEREMSKIIKENENFRGFFSNTL